MTIAYTLVFLGGPTGSQLAPGPNGSRGEAHGRSGTGEVGNTSKWVQHNQRWLTGVHCSRCGKPTGKRGNCDECRSYVVEWKKANAQRVLASAKKQREKNRLIGRSYDKRKVWTIEELLERQEVMRFRRDERKRLKRAKRRAGGGRLSWGIVRRLMKAQGGLCVYCRCEISTAYHLDHILPLALGGKNEDQNVQLLCGPCNISKGAKHPVDFANGLGLLP